MADTNSHADTPTRPQPHLGACTTAELTSYENGLRQVLATSRDAAERMRIMSELSDVEEQWETRARIEPGFAGRTWPIHNSM